MQRQQFRVEGGVRGLVVKPGLSIKACISVVRKKAFRKVVKFEKPALVTILDMDK